MAQRTHPLSWYQMVKTFVTSHVTQDPSLKVHFCVVKRPFIGTINDRTCDLGSRAPAFWQPSYLLSSIAGLALKMKAKCLSAHGQGPHNTITNWPLPNLPSLRLVLLSAPARSGWYLQRRVRRLRDPMATHRWQYWLWPSAAV